MTASVENAQSYTTPFSFKYSFTYQSPACSTVLEIELVGTLIFKGMRLTVLHVQYWVNNLGGNNSVIC